MTRNMRISITLPMDCVMRGRNQDPATTLIREALVDYIARRANGDAVEYVEGRYALQNAAFRAMKTERVAENLRFMQSLLAGADIDIDWPEEN